ncbi:TPA: hypothetical protein I8622_005923 [Klebsiella oxytoca]|uniref:phage head spike fiber domain-containing protein n=2 Tax=Klebsiella TaxID=570 RepID=UPI000CD36518|nr:hypothetical protein [Klebsiella aerogenes]AUV91015.1 hypothetical protein C2U44_07990 [Klebsiella oxytoca]HBM3012686.1 hypothetical protein [Klebsiella michiganensis]HDT0329714.1 hypothetical protein [Klebsiella pneumoniae]POT94198.1 hypothetical protein C3417_05885 [Klebsiella oxytoca]POV45170.1 hypothetical protein C3409_32530 [Klebsiella oxytoca]
MATQIKSNKTYQGDAAALPSPQAPMPKLASLYLDFEKELYISLGRTTGNAIRSRRLADVVTFTRASETTRVNKSGLIEYLASGEAAIEFDPITGECLGLRVAAGTTNQAANSENFSGSTWTKSGVSTTAAKITAPDGNVTASPFNESTDSADTVHYMQENATPAATVGSPITFSIFAKANTASVIQLVALGAVSTTQFANFDLINGMRTRSSSGVLQTSMRKYKNGWYRLSITITPAGTTSPQFTLALVNDVTSAAAMPAYTGSGKGIYIWGGQIENWDGATPYIPTAGATVTRPDEVCTVRQDLDFMAADRGAIFADYNMPASLQAMSGVYNAGQAIVCIDNDSVAEYVSFLNRRISNSITNQNLAAAAKIVGSSEITVEVKRLGQVRNGHQSFISSFINGDMRVFDGINKYSGAPLVSAQLNRLMIGRARTTPAAVSNAYLKRLVYYPTTLVDADLVTQFNALS